MGCQVVYDTEPGHMCGCCEVVYDTEPGHMCGCCQVVYDTEPGHVCGCCQVLCGVVACCRCKMPYSPFCEQIYKKKLKVIKKDKSLCSAEDVFNI